MGHSSVPVGLFSVSAPKPSFRRFRCSAWLILRRSPTGTSAPKRSCSRFASLTLRTAHRSPVSLCFSPKRTTSRFASLTLRTPHRPPVSSPLAAAAALWLPCVRGAVRRRAGLRGCLRIRGKGKGRRPSPVSAPNRLFELLRCFARLIRQAETLDLQPLRGLHRSTLCFFFQNAHASGSLRSPSVSAPKPSFRRFRCSAWLILQFRTESAFQAAPVFRSAYSASRNARPPAASRPPSKRTALSPLKRSCSRFASLTLRTPHRPPVSSPLAAAAD